MVGAYHERNDANPPLDAETGQTVSAFHRLYYDRWQGETGPIAVDWRGVRALKCPLDLWMYQEIIHRRRPDLIVETGTYRGGSALFLADMCALAGQGRVVSIDVSNHDAATRLPSHDCLRYLAGSSTDVGIVAEVFAMAEALATPGRNAEVLVILDSLHTLPHVFAELAAYAPLIEPGGYLIVEDTNVNGRPVLPGYGPGPAEAVAMFLGQTDDFERDRGCERFLMTLNPGGYLRRRAANI
jgi:cephalosporin hydroxylase